MPDHTYRFDKPTLLVFHGGAFDGLEVDCLEAPELVVVTGSFGGKARVHALTDSYAELPKGGVPYIRESAAVPPINYVLTDATP